MSGNEETLLNLSKAVRNSKEMTPNNSTDSLKEEFLKLWDDETKQTPGWYLDFIQERESIAYQKGLDYAEGYARQLFATDYKEDIQKAREDTVRSLLEYVTKYPSSTPEWIVRDYAKLNNITL